MKRLTVFLLVLAMALMGATTVMAAGLPQALHGVNLATAQPLTDAQAQQIRGAAYSGPPPGIGTPTNPGPGGLHNGLTTVDTLPGSYGPKGIGIADGNVDRLGSKGAQLNSRVFSFIY